MLTGLRQISWVFLCALFVLISTAGWAKPISLFPDTQEIDLMPLALATLDPSGTASLEEIQQQGSFQPLDKNLILPGFKKQVYWFKWTLVNRDPMFTNQIFQLAPPWSLRSTLFVVDQNQQVVTHNIGLNQLFWQREIPHPAQLAKLKLPLNEPVDLYLRTQIYEGQLDLSLWRPIAFLVEDWQHSMMLSGLLGVILAVGLYNLFLYFSIKDLTYLYYVIFVFSGLLYGLSNEGLIQVFWPNSPYWNRYNGVLFIGLGYLAYFLFTQRFLETKKYVPLADKLLYPLMGFALLVSLTVTQLYHWKAVYPLMSALLVLVSAPVLSGLGLYIYFVRKRPQARLYALGSTFLQVWLLLQVAQVFGLVGGNSLFISGSSGILIGFAVMDLALSFALADRINLLRIEKNQANRTIIQIKSGEANRLSALVEERTATLKQNNEEQRMLLSIIAHDLRGPAGGIAVMLQELTLLEEEIPANELKIVAQSAMDLYLSLEDLLKWAKSLQSGVRLDRETHRFVSDIYEPVWPLVKLIAETHQVEVQLNILSQQVYGEAQAIQAVLRNLVVNAIKASPLRGVVSIKVVEIQEGVQVYVTNEGPGLNQAQMAVLNRISPPKGLSSGLGLLLCKQLVDLWGGDIGFKQNEQGQTSVYFTLPKLNSLSTEA